MTIEQVTTFLAWNTLINIGILLFATAFIVAGRDWVMSIHSRLTGVAVDDLPRLYFQYLAGYKIAIIVLCLVPYLIVRLVMS